MPARRRRSRPTRSVFRAPPPARPRRAIFRISRGCASICSQLNDKGGVNGAKIDFIVLDDKAAPSEAANNAKRLMDDEQVLAVALMSLSSTYAPMFQAATRTKTPAAAARPGGVPGQCVDAADEPLRLLRRQHVRSEHRRLLAGPAGQGAGREEQGQAEARAGGDGHSDQPAGHRQHGAARRRARASRSSTSRRFRRPPPM